MINKKLKNIKFYLNIVDILVKFGYNNNVNKRYEPNKKEKKKYLMVIDLFIKMCYNKYIKRGKNYV